MRCSMSVALGFTCLLALRAGADDQVKAVIEKAVKAHGGEANLTKYKAVVQSGKGVLALQGMELEFTATISGQLPDKVREEIHLESMGQKLDIIRVFNGKEGWTAGMGQTQPFSDAEIKEAKNSMFENYVENLVPLLKDKELKVELIGDDKVDDKPVVGVKVSAKDQNEIKLYFDKDSGLLVKSARKAIGPNEMEVLSESFYQDYKDVSGIKVPMKETTKHDGAKFLEINVTDAKVLEKLDDSTFAKP